MIKPPPAAAPVFKKARRSNIAWALIALPQSLGHPRIARARPHPCHPPVPRHDVSRAGYADRCRNGRANCFAIEMHCECATKRHPTTILGASETKRLAKDPEQRRRWVYIHL